MKTLRNDNVLLFPDGRRLAWENYRRAIDLYDEGPVNPYVLRSLQEVVDSSHIVFGTDYVWAQSWMTPLFVKALREYNGFDEQALALVERESALELFPRFKGK